MHEFLGDFNTLYMTIILTTLLYMIWVKQYIYICVYVCVQYICVFIHEIYFYLIFVHSSFQKFSNKKTNLRGLENLFIALFF